MKYISPQEMMIRLKHQKEVDEQRSRVSNLRETYEVTSCPFDCDNCSKAEDMLKENYISAKNELDTLIKDFKDKHEQ